MRIDAHQHFWNYSAEEYPWIGKGMERLARDCLPTDLAPLVAAEGIGGTVAVQARQSLEESRWLLGLADAHPRVLGVGSNPAVPAWQNPNTVATGEGYKSPSNAQCLYPSLKTRLLERHCMEPYLGANPAVAGGQTPYQWNHSFRARSYAAFFDGSVRLFTTGEAMDSEARARVPGASQPARLWVRSTPLGQQGFGGNIAEDFLVSTSVHYLTASGIRGRDTLSPP